MCRAIASAWLSPDGRSDRNRALVFLAEARNEDLADHAIKGPGLDCCEDHVDNCEPPTWMEERGVTREDIMAAFAWLRKISMIVPADDCLTHRTLSGAVPRSRRGRIPPKWV
jgi:hypothetical protein